MEDRLEIDIQEDNLNIEIEESKKVVIKYDDTEVKQNILDLQDGQLKQDEKIKQNAEKIEMLHNYDDTEVKQELKNLQDIVNSKVDKIDGKDLSQNDFTDDLKAKLDNLYNYDDNSLKTQIQANTEILDNLNKKIDEKVDKTEGKELSSNDFSNEYKEKLDSLNNYDDTEIKNEFEKLKEENSLLKSQIPVGHASGENIHLKDSSNLPIEEIKISGNSYQEITETSPSIENPSEIKVSGENGSINIIKSDLNIEENFNIPVQKPMLKGDCFEKINGIWKEKHTWDLINLDGSQKITFLNAPNEELANKFSTAYFSITYLPKDAIGNEFISNKFLKTYKTPSEIWGLSSSAEMAEGIALDSNSVRIRINKSRLEGFKNDLTNTEKANLLKSYLQHNNILIYYKLAQPLYLECTPEQVEVLEQLQKIKTHKNETIIYSDDEVSPQFEITYRKDLESVEKIQDEKILNLQITTENKVEKIDGKNLSTNDFTNEYKTKLEELKNYNDEVLINRINIIEQSIGDMEIDLDDINGEVI